LVSQTLQKMRIWGHRKKLYVQLMFPTRVFPECETWIFRLFSTTRNPGFFKYQTRVFQKTWNCCCIQILIILITLKLQIGACNGQISTFELSTTIMRHEVRVLFGDHRTFVVGPFIFPSFDLFRRIVTSFCT